MKRFRPGGGLGVAAGQASKPDPHVAKGFLTPTPTTLEIHLSLITTVLLLDG